MSREDQSISVAENRPGSKPASLRPGWIVRLIDRVVLRGSRLEEQLEDVRTVGESDSRERSRAVMVFTILTGLYSIFGEPEHTSLFFATAGAVALGGKAWHSWTRRRLKRTKSDPRGSNAWQTASDAAAGVAAALAVMAAMLISMPRFPSGSDGIMMVAPAIAAALAYRRRELSDPAPEHTLFVSGLALIAVVGLMVLMRWGFGF